jgi:putative hydrolase
VSGPGPDDDPLGGIPFLGDLARMMGGQGPVSWETARQVAVAVATEGRQEPNVDPSVRFAWAELARIAELHVQGSTGLETMVGGRPTEVVPVTPGVLAIRTLDAYRPLLEQLAASLGSAPPILPDDETSPEAAMLAPLLGLLQPAMLGLSVGGMVGHLAHRAFGQYDLPLPRPQHHELLVVPATVDAFGRDWSLPADDLRLWVCLQELTTHAVVSIPHVHDTLQELLVAYAAGFRPDPSALMGRFENLDLGAADPMAQMQQLFGDPELLLGAIRSPAQESILPRLDALVAVVIGFVDHTVDAVADGLLTSGSRVAEAVRRRRVEADTADRFVERLLGVSVTQAQVDRGARFVAGVMERAGPDGLARLWSSTRELPTPAEVDAPGLWLARIDLPQ